MLFRKSSAGDHCGECPPFKPYSHWREFRDQFGSRITTRVITDAGHALFPEQPDLIAGAVLPWLQCRTS
jgi:pimeloyl-ACP methyl ester carboxylesterase